MQHVIELSVRISDIFNPGGWTGNLYHTQCGSPGFFSPAALHETTCYHDMNDEPPNRVERLAFPRAAARDD